MAALNIERAFGTDGIRGVFDKEPLTVPSILELSYALMAWMRQRNMLILCIARDTRVSGETITNIFSDVLTRGGISVIDCGIVPTPVLAFLTIHHRCDIGIMVTASHNPASDNGIKFIQSSGEKWPAAWESSLVELWKKSDRPQDTPCKPYQYVPMSYVPYLMDIQKNHAVVMHGEVIVVDLAHGAATSFMTSYLTEMGFKVHAMHATPDGSRINDQASVLNPARLSAMVVDQQAYCGLAVDGDADRLIMVDNKGVCWDGDDMLYALIMADHMRGVHHEGVIITHMNNGGLEDSLAQLGVCVRRVDVGDKYIVQGLHETSWHVGGEPCGHIIDIRYAQGSDPLRVFLQMLSYLQYCGVMLAEVPRPLRYPQRQQSLSLDGLKVSSLALQAFASTRYPVVRWVIRLSGTERKMRIMGEYCDAILLDVAMDRVVQYANSGIE